MFAGLATGEAGFYPVGNPDGLESSLTPDDGPPTGGPQCKVCGRDVPLTPTGRVPKNPLCEDHKTRTKEPAGAASAARNTRAKAHQTRIDAIIGDLQQGAGELAGTMAPVAPVTAGTILLTAPDGIVALVRIASDYPRMLDGLEAVAKGVPWISVGKFVAGIMLAVAVDMGRLAPVGIAAEYLRVAEAAERVGWRPPESTLDGQFTEASPGGMPTAGPHTAPGKGKVAPPRFTMG